MVKNPVVDVVPRTVTVEGKPAKYQLFVPSAGAVSPLPVILFLHGAGESGNDGVRQTTVGIGPAIRNFPERFPCIVVFPQASKGYGWRGFNLRAAIAALDEVEGAYETDRSREYVTGISMGGFGTWLACLEQPDRFAAAVPVCGGLDAAAALHVPELTSTATHNLVETASKRIAHIPQWVFHGADDDIVPVTHSRQMVEALRAAGADVRYTEYEGVRHNSWDRAYAEPELMPWLLSHRRTGR